MKNLIGSIYNEFFIDCRSNEHFDNCGSSCEDTCENVNVSCAQVCKEGCFCNDNLVRGELGDCYDPINCYSNFFFFYLISSLVIFVNSRLP